MEIVDFEWNKFLVVLPRNKDEDQQTYRRRVVYCLREFYNRYTSLRPAVDIFWMLKGNIENKHCRLFRFHRYLKLDG